MKKSVFRLNDKIATFLGENPEQKFTARGIAKHIIERYSDDCLAKQELSTATTIPLDTDEAFLTQIIAKIGSQRPRFQKRYPELKTTEGCPQKYSDREKKIKFLRL